MINTVNNLITIQETLKNKIKISKQSNIIAVSKTFPIESIFPLINHGHEHYGENKVQEAIEKWTTIKQDFINIKLHLIGKLQTNKVKFVIPLFDYIHTLDNTKLAEKIANEEIKKNKKLKIFIQVNIGKEEQKNGIEVEKLTKFYELCKKDFKLDIIGLMCIPPQDKNSETYFVEMKKISAEMGLTDLSMGMSDDYLDASKNEATFLRIGSKIFGKRD
jgi:pyridoxal phosphate enzyme (YggS family)